MRATRYDNTSTTWHIFNVSYGPCLFHEIVSCEFWNSWNSGEFEIQINSLGTGYSTPELTPESRDFGPGFRGRSDLPVSFSSWRTKSSVPNGRPVLVAIRMCSLSDAARPSFKNSFQLFPSKRDPHISIFRRPESSTPVMWALALDHGHSHASLTSPARTGLSSTYRSAFQK